MYRYRTLSIVLFVVALLGLTACSPFQSNTKIKAEDMMNKRTAASVSNLSPDATFIANTADFSIQLFQETFAGKQNTLISPLSVLQALAMTANGADRETLAQMENLLGQGMKLAELNPYLHTYTQSLLNGEDGTLKLANSIWFNDDEKRLRVEPDFLQTNADYYKAAAYRAAFDHGTVADINRWVNNNTDGLIDQMVEELNPNAVMLLINAIVFEAEWESPYWATSVRKDTFTAADGSKLTMDMMNSAEYKYVNDGQATGFIKPYTNHKYSFVALLPDESIAIEEYVASLTGASWLKAIGDAEATAVHAVLPKFKYDYAASMNETLRKLGIPDAFSQDKADFSKLGTSPAGNIFIGDVLHKAYISVDELGTKAGAATKVEMLAGSAPNFITVKLDRPFVYAIIDDETKLPIFIGVMMGV
jgi:serine protease inhibitor